MAIVHGTTGTVTQTGPEGLIIEFDGLGAITIPTGKTDILDLAYALTAYSVQGATFDEAEITATPGEPIESVYVGLTRGRHANTLIATASPQAESHQPDPGTGLDPAAELAETITANNPVPALVADPDLVHVINPQHHQQTQRIRDRIESDDTARAVRRAHLDPPAWFLDRHGPRPTTPWLAEQWDTALTEAAAEHRLQASAPTGRTRQQRRADDRRPPRRGGLTR